MTKKLKLTLTMILSALLLASALFCFSPKVAKAETLIQEGEYFEILPGAAIRQSIKTTVTPDGKSFFDEEKDLYSLGFFLKPTSDYVHWKSFHDYAHEWRNTKLALSWDRVEIDELNTFQAYEFKLRHKGVSNSELIEEATSDIVSLRIVFGFNPTDLDFEYAVSIKKHDTGWSNERFPIPSFHNFNNEGREKIEELANNTVWWEAQKEGFSLVYSGRTESDGFTFDANGEYAFEVLLDSYVESYDVIFNYWGCRAVNYGNLFLDNYDEEKHKNELQISDTRSVKQVLTMLNEDGVLEENVSEDALSLAQEIIADESFRKIKIYYLEEIEGTPFAEKKSLTLEDFPVAGAEISRRDVEARTGKDFKIFNTWAEEFVVRTETLESSVYVFDAYYLKDSHLEATTKEGHTCEFFFNLNVSFKEAFATPMNEKAPLITNDHYQYAWGQLKSAYPILRESEFKETEVYGRFGFVSIPDVKTSVAGIVSSFFGKEVEQMNLKTMWRLESAITREQYSILLNDYQYTSNRLWWEEAFSDATLQSHEATHYMFYAAPGESSIKEEEPITGGIGNGIKEMWKSFGKLLTSLGGIMNDIFGSKAGVGGLLIVAAIGVGVYFYFKSGGSLTKGKSGKAPSMPKPTSFNMFGGKKKSKPRRTAKRKKRRNK